jgi:hypothetical protein
MKMKLGAGPEKYVSICSDSQEALKALQAAKTTSPLVRQCYKALNNISTGTLWGYIGSLDIPECEERKLLTSSQETVLFNGLLDLSLSWGSVGRIQEDKTMDGKPASGIVVWSLLYTETGLRIDFWP